jgi:SAM-dependent methyltransferase
VTDRQAFFEGRYASGEPVPWDRKGEPFALLVEWAGSLVGDGRRAVVVGCGLGGDAEFLAGLGFVTDGFDFAPTAIDQARRRHPDSVVDYAVADLLDLPPDRLGAYDLVVECFTAQSLPRSVRPAVAAAVRSLVAPGGTVLVVSEQQGVRPDEPTGPWPLSRADVESFAGDGLTLVRLDEPDQLWRAELQRL